MTTPEGALPALLPDHRHLVDGTDGRLALGLLLRLVLGDIEDLELETETLGPGQGLAHVRRVITTHRHGMLAVGGQGHLISDVGHVGHPLSCILELDFGGLLPSLSAAFSAG